MVKKSLSRKQDNLEANGSWDELRAMCRRLEPSMAAVTNASRKYKTR